MEVNINNINSADVSVIKDILDKKIGKFFGACGISYRTTENCWFKDLVYTLIAVNPNKIDYVVPNRHVLSSTIIPSVQSELDQEKKKLLNNTYSILMLDGWLNDSAKRHFLVFTLRNVNTSQAFLSFYDYTGESEDGDLVSNEIVEAIKLAKSKYNTTVCGVINDNASNMLLGASLASDIVIEENINTSIRGLFQSTCNSHSGNLLIKDIVDKDLLDELGKIVKAFSKSRIQKKIYDKGGCPLKSYPETRFCYVVYTCESIYKNLEYLREVATEEGEIPEDITELVKSMGFERKVWGTMHLLAPICKLINHCQDSKVNVADATEMWLSLKLPSHDYDNKIQERIVKAISDIGYATNLVHHIYKGNRLDEDQLACAKRFLNGHLDEIGQQELQNFLDSKNNTVDFGEDCGDPIAYWAVKALEYPVLGVLCQKIMLMPASTALLEGLFSQWSYIHNKYRNNLSNNSTGFLIDIYHLSKHLEKGFWIEVKNNKKRKRMDLDD